MNCNMKYSLIEISLEVYSCTRNENENIQLIMNTPYLLSIFNRTKIHFAIFHDLHVKRKKKHHINGL